MLITQSYAPQSLDQTTTAREQKWAGTEAGNQY